MITTIAKSFTFDAAHRLDRLPPEHKCHRLHGHTYRVEITMRGELDEQCMVADYDALDAWWQPIHERLDHRYLNEVTGLGIPTTEMLAKWIWFRLVEAGNERFMVALHRVRVYESSTTWAEVGGDA